MEMNVNNIKKKKERINMNKPFMFLMLFLTTLFSANALTMSFNQNSNVYDYETIEKGNNIYNFQFGDTDIFKHSFDSTNYSYDYRLELKEMNQEFFLVIENFYINTSYQVFFHGDLTQDDTLYVQELTLNEQGFYILKFIPSGIEGGQIFIDLQSEAMNNGTIPALPFGVSYVETKPEGFNDLIGGLVGTFEAVFDINLKLWYLLYYVIIFVLVIGFMSMLFGVASFLFKKSDEIKNRKRIVHNDNKEDN